jgi:2-oxoglutarate dehydrogenase E1 component
MDNLSYLSNAHAEVIDEMYQKFLNDPYSVDYGWRKFFEGFDFAVSNYGGGQSDSGLFLKEIAVMNLIEGYRARGHLFTTTNPVRKRRTYEPTLDIENFGLNENDLDTEFQAGSEVGLGPATLREILNLLNQTYRKDIGAEYRYIRNPKELKWLQEKMEKSRNTPAFSPEEKKFIYRDLNKAVLFENFLHRKFTGQKRFSLEGLECLIPALDTFIDAGSARGIEEYDIGMAHRGRLNVLVNIMNKKPEDIFREFEGELGWDEVVEDDVKYHLGYSSDRESKNGKTVHIRLAANPSHLESVDPVVEGMARAKLESKFNYDENKVCPILVHGDASLSGQGIVYELIQMSKLKAYNTGGTIHVATNNQVGFTTNYLDGRSSTYCTDVAKVTLSPVFHVNADDVEAVIFVARLAMEYRQTFHKDVFIDLLGYRKYGHNEGDEPRYTQPQLYEIISKHPNPRDIYRRKLISEGVITAEEASEIEKEYLKYLDERFTAAKTSHKLPAAPFMRGSWIGFRLPEDNDFLKSPETGIPEKLLLELGKKAFHIPEEMPVYRKIRKLFDDRLKMLSEKKADWAVAEILAYATLVSQGTPVRISGQDVERGTFAHRHAVVTLADSEERYIPLQQVQKMQAPFKIYNSLLSEYAVLGFEFGYSMATPLGLTIWEAQFGDFANGAQVIFDQYISSSALKWQRMSGITIFLPHGFEGQGPEHSSARLERYLELCADNNMQVANPTTPANLFHLLRRQVMWPFRIPLIVMTPKSLLRHPLVKSGLTDLSEGRFLEVIDDKNVKPEKVRKILFCSGKIYYDLLEKQTKDRIDDVAVVRVEQLYPLPENRLKEVVNKYKNTKRWVWVQEEPENMGAWAYILRNLRKYDIEYTGRAARSSPATGSSKIHAAEQAKIVNEAFS